MPQSQANVFRDCAIQNLNDGERFNNNGNLENERNALTRATVYALLSIGERLEHVRDSIDLAATTGGE